MRWYGQDWSLAISLSSDFFYLRFLHPQRMYSGLLFYDTTLYSSSSFVIPLYVYLNRRCPGWTVTWSQILSFSVRRLPSPLHEVFSFVCWSTKMKKIYSFPSMVPGPSPFFFFHIVHNFVPSMERDKSTLISCKLSTISPTFLEKKKKDRNVADITSIPLLRHNPRFLAPYWESLLNKTYPYTSRHKRSVGTGDAIARR